MFARIQIKNENIQLLLLGSLFVFSSVKERDSSYSAETFQHSVACKTSKFDKRKFVIIAADSVAVDEVTKFTDVGYNFGLPSVLVVEWKRSSVVLLDSTVH